MVPTLCAFRVILQSPIVHAASKGHDNTVSALVNLQGDPNLVTQMGSTALFVAATEGKASTVRLLADMKASIDAPNTGGTVGAGVRFHPLKLNAFSCCHRLHWWQHAARANLKWPRHFWSSNQTQAVPEIMYISQ